MRLTWNAIGERFFETGVDRGVLYVDAVGVPWNGLVSVSEAPTGAEVTPYYIDGVKYLNHMSSEEFEATVEAYTYPDEFGPCEGIRSVANGLSLAQQPRKQFGLCYRTIVGNDVEGVDHGYKIHLVYNALAAPSERSNTTTGEEVEPFNFSWDIVTKPPTFIGYKHTAHFVIDSRETPSELLSRIEDILYGSDTTNPRQPSVPELLFIFEEYQAAFFDAGRAGDEYFASFDAGRAGDPYTSTIDGGGP